MVADGDLETVHSVGVEVVMYDSIKLFLGKLLESQPLAGGLILAGIPIILLGAAGGFAGYAMSNIKFRRVDVKFTGVTALLRTLPYLSFGMMTISVSRSFAQAANSPDHDAAMVFAKNSFITSKEAIIAFSVLMFGFLMSLAAIYLLRAVAVHADEVIRLMALLVIVTGVLFLIAAGYSATDISPALGLLGTIAGYLLGRTDRRDTTNPEKEGH